MVRGWRETLSRCAAAAANYFFGRDMDGVAVPEANPMWVRAVKTAPERRGAARTRAGVRRAEEGDEASPMSREERARLAEAVESARREWVAARNYFDNVVDPDLVDFAVLSIGAAEKRYMFLLDRAREADIHVDPLTLNV